MTSAETAVRFTGQLDDGDSITVGQFTVTAHIVRDDDMGAPWKEHDFHGPVSEWTRRDKSPGERVLCEHHGSRRYYDFAEAVKIAKRDGWDAPPFGQGTPNELLGERAARAAEADFKRLRDWCRDAWWWVGVVLSVAKAGHTLDDHAASLWGIESDAGDYFSDVANDLLPEALAVAEKVLAELCN